MTAVTTTPEPPATGQPGPAKPASGVRALHLIRSELLKVRTTNTWWIFLIGVFLATALAATVWIAVGNSQINAAVDAQGEEFVPPEGASQAEIDILRQQFELSQDLTRTLHDVSAEIYTSGQFFGLMFALLLGSLLITNEFHHQTATTTFLVTPRRTQVILAKLATAMIGAGFFWTFATALSVAAGAIFLTTKGYGTQLTEWPVLRAILLNALAYGLWGVLGVGLGVLIRNQIGAVLTGALAYVVGTFLIQQIVFALYFLLEWEWVLDLMVLWPGVASQVMISPEPPYPGSPSWWSGALVLVAYGVGFGVIGTLITRRRDIS